MKKQDVEWLDSVSVRVKDKVFRIYLKEREIKRRVSEMAAEIDRDFAEKDPFFVIILNGAFIFGADLCRELTIPAQLSSTRLQSYAGTESSGEVKVLMPLHESVVGRDVIIVEDVVDSGLTMETMVKQMETFGARSVSSAVLLFKPEACKVENPKVDYCGFKIPNEFVVGYGLDYDEAGRGIPDICAYIGEAKDFGG